MIDLDALSSCPAAKKFGDTCYKRKLDDERWEPEAIKILKGHAKFLKIDSTRQYVFSKEVDDLQTQIVKALSDLDAITVYTTEIDDDHNEMEKGYFPTLRNTIKKHMTDMLVVTTSQRKPYLTTNTNFKGITDYENKTFTTYSADKYSVLVFDRCHSLSISDFGEAIRRFFGKKIKTLYLFGSTLCFPNSPGQPFNDIQKSIYLMSGITERSVLTSDIPTKEKIAGYFDNVESMIENRKKSGYIHLFVENAPLKRSLMESLKGKSNGVLIKTIHELKYSDSPMQTTAIVLNESTTMNIHKLAKCFQCASPAPKSVVIIGTEHDLFRVMSKPRQSKNSVLEHLLNSYNQENLQ